MILNPLRDSLLGELTVTYASFVCIRRATSALKLQFTVKKELRNHLEILPRSGFIQAQSTFTAQIKFLPR